jgi:hypothetical protein
MKRSVLTRLAALEERRARATAEKNPFHPWSERTVIIAILMWHVGRWDKTESPASAYARALGVTDEELQHALYGDADAGADIWVNAIERLAALVAERGGRLDHDPTAQRNYRNEYRVIDVLYKEVSVALKEKLGLYLDFIDFFL